MKPLLARFYLPAIAAAILIFSCSCAAECAGTEKVWQINQESCTLGPITVLVSDSAFSWSNPKSGLTIATHAPGWKFVAFNDANKKYMSLTGAELVELVSPKKEHKGKGKKEKWPIISGSDVIKGIPVVRLIHPAHMDISEADAMKMFKIAKAGGKLDGKLKKLADSALKEARDEIWVARDIPVPETAMSLLPEKIPPALSPHVFIRMITVNDKGVKRTMMDTQKISRCEKTAEDFKQPADYKKAENRIALFVDDSEFDDIAPVAPSKVTKK